MLDVRDLTVSYGKHRALGGVSLRVKPGEIVVILGANGAGKSTLLKSIAGICEGQVGGSITMDGEAVTGQPAHKVVETGIALVPEGRGVFGDLTVRENLKLGANPARSREDADMLLDRILRLFPKLGDRAGQMVSTMSGGEQQMVAIGRAMMSNPTILMLDEPSLGLSPLLSKELFQALKAVGQTGLGILLVEQNAKLSLGIADRGYLLENGQILREDKASVLRDDPAVQAAYLGGAGGSAKPAAAAAKPAAAARAPLEPVAASARPASVVPRQAPQHSVSASQISGLDIDAIVAQAGRQSVEQSAPRARVTTPMGGKAASVPMSPAHNDALAKALAEIEAAAARSLKRTTHSTAGLPPLRPTARPAAPAPAPASAAPSAAPIPNTDAPAALAGGRVEIWRRQSGTNSFTRTEP